MAEASPLTAAAHPFDAHAVDYDQHFTHTLLGRWLRAAVWAVLRENFCAGQHVLEIGAGTGEDAVWLAERGVEVTATDASAGMLAVGRSKAQRQSLDGRVIFRQIDWSAAEVAAPIPYDGVLANFGVLNCIGDRRGLARRLAPAVRPGARMVVVMMGSLCAWEIAWRLGHGEVRAAWRRRRAGAPARVAGGPEFPVWYPSPGELTSELAPLFRRRSLSGLGFLLPPSELHHLVARWPRGFALLRDLDRRLARTSMASRFADHYVMVFERTEQRVDFT